MFTSVSEAATRRGGAIKTKGNRTQKAPAAPADTSTTMYQEAESAVIGKTNVDTGFDTAGYGSVVAWELQAAKIAE